MLCYIHMMRMWGGDDKWKKIFFDYCEENVTNFLKVFLIIFMNILLQSLKIFTINSTHAFYILNEH